MKQGSAGYTAVEYKTQPKAHSINPAATDQLGNMLGNHATSNGQRLPGASVPLYRGRGLEAPMVGTTCHRSGSQGRR
jgi:hypothetical protein